LQATQHRIGRRGTFLLFLAVLDLAYGYSLETSPLRDNSVLFLPLRVWTVAWYVTGVLCFGSAFAKLDRIGFTVAAVLTTGWAGENFNAWLFGHEPRGWVAAVVFASFAATIVMVSSWPETIVVLRPRHLKEGR